MEDPSYSLQDDASDPIVLQMSLNDIPVNMELDTGASISVLTRGHTNPAGPPWCATQDIHRSANQCVGYSEDHLLRFSFRWSVGMDLT